jgi:hypothetical protein
MNLKKNGFQIKTSIAGERKFPESLYKRLRYLDTAIQEREESNQNKKPLVTVKKTTLLVRPNLI